MGLLGWAVGLPAAIVVPGVAMALLGVFVAVRFPEDNFMPARGQHWAASLLALRRGVALARGDRQILLVLAATMVVNGAGMISCLFARRRRATSGPPSILFSPRPRLPGRSREGWRSW